ncbi:MAG: 1-deoxy-D-xylulose-5-phosphate reductoisomerase, partial [Candidatus Sedimenticola sp. 20ELBAFRAG]
IARLDFEPPDMQRFPCLKLAYQAVDAGGTAPAVLNAANEVAVSLFLDGRLGFTDIPRVIETTLDQLPSVAATDLGVLLDADREARLVAEHNARSLV